MWLFLVHLLLPTSFKYNSFDKKKGDICSFFRWDSSGGPSTPPNASDAESYLGLSLPPSASTQPHATPLIAPLPLKDKCHEMGCTSTCIHKECKSQKCMAYCKAGGGCLAAAHHVIGGTPCTDPLSGAAVLSASSTTPPPPTVTPSIPFPTLAASLAPTPSSLAISRLPAPPTTSNPLAVAAPSDMPSQTINSYPTPSLLHRWC